jgi:putative SOS response-associated peptidase YedK
MCGRFTLAAPSEELVEVFAVPPLDVALRPRFNVAPGQDALVVGEDRRGRRMGMLGWGLVPAWASGPGKPFVNARAETVGRTRSFREAFLHRRCLVPADGFYEWHRDEWGKTPYLFRPAAGGILALAAVWERWEGAGEPARDGFAILTVGANDDVSPVHHRMPVLVAPSDFGLWLHRGSSPEELRPVLVAAPSGTLRSHPVSRRVNSVSEDDPGLVEPA